MQNIKLLINSLVSIFITIVSINFFVINSESEFQIITLLNVIISGWYYLFCACLLLLISVYLRSYRWKYLFDSNVELKLSFLFKSQLIGYFTNNILPIRVGDVIRSYVVAKNTNNKTSYVIGTIAMERFLDTVTILFFSLIIFWHYGTDYLEIKYNFTSIPFILCFLLAPILGYLFYSLILKFSFPIKINQIINNIWRGFSAIQFKHKRAIIFYSIIIWVIYCINVFLIQLIFIQFKLSIFDCLLILVASSFLQMIPVGFGAFGVFHLGVQGVLNKLGVQGYQNFIILLHLYSLVMYTVSGGYFFFSEKTLNIKKLYNELIANQSS